MRGDIAGLIVPLALWIAHPSAGAAKEQEAPAAEEAKPAEAPAAPTPEEVGRWIRSLGSESFEEREEASKRLRKAGILVRTALRESAESGDLEARARAKTILEQIEADLAAGGRRYRLGVGMEEALEGERRFVRVREVFPGSPAEKAGIQVGDVVTRFAGRAIEVPDDLAAAVREAKTGQEVEVEVEREGKRQSIRLKLGEEKVVPPEPQKEEPRERIQILELQEEE